MSERKNPAQQREGETSKMTERRNDKTEKDNEEARQKNKINKIKK